jgi:hypothetical protein
MIRRGQQNIAFSIAMLCGLLVSFHLNIHDVTPALLPAALLVGRTQKYLLLPLFGLPVLLLHLGSSWFFLLALPLGAMLLYAIISSRHEVASEPETVAAPA